MRAGSDSNDATKRGGGKKVVDRLISLILIFENPVLDFSKDRADGDDILGAAYEYVMLHFRHRERQEQGPLLHSHEVNRIMAQISDWALVLSRTIAARWQAGPRVTACHSHGTDNTNEGNLGWHE